MDQPQHDLFGPDSSLFQVNLDAQNSINLRSAATWSKVLGLVGVISGLAFIIALLIQLTRLTDYGYYSRNNFLTATRVGLWMMILAGIVSTLAGVFSFIFGNRIQAALNSNNQQGLNEGFAALRNFFAVRSILLIIIVLLFLLALTASM